MPRPALYLDECVDHRLARSLRQSGIDVLTVQEALASGNDDESQIERARLLGRVFMSHNQIHFRRLHRTFRERGRAHGGLLLLPQTVPLERLEARAGLLLDWLATFETHASELFTWSDLQQKLIHGFRLPNWPEGLVQRTLGWG